MYIIHMSALKMCHALYFYEKPDCIVCFKKNPHKQEGYIR